MPSDEHIAAMRDRLHGAIVSAFPAAKKPVLVLVLNFDQMFLLYDGGTTRKRTYAKKGSKRVTLADPKDGFTCMVCISMEGVVGSQLIFGGKTSAVHPTVPPGKFLHYLHNITHWSNEETTLLLFEELIKPYVTHMDRTG
jgi:hypothetical protein